ncbi:MAG TPA: cysteine desulfurase family protein [Candidatus Saccharimonadales bacterium]|nr:cysteine desulfurase family protein [Candidatus Saccharimonadales bacterium]
MSHTNLIYLDHAAATPLDAEVLAAMQPYFSAQFYNPSATYLPAQQVRKDLEAARSRVAHWVGARPSEIIFTAGGTEANNLAIHGILQAWPDGHVVTSAIEHESVLAPAAQYSHSTAPVDAHGIVRVDALLECITDTTVLVSVMYANNEVGTIQPLKTITQAIRDLRERRRQAGNTRPLYVHTDAAQAGNYLDLHAARLGVDLMTINGGKLYGPKQSGVLYVSAGIVLQPLVLGGGQERNLRSGTENVAGSIGLAAALERAQTNRHDETYRLQLLQNQFIALLSAAIPSVTINGSLKHRLPNNVHITLPGQDNERILYGLDEAGVLAAAGSACSASNEEPSHVLRAMGITAADAQSSLRFTMGRETREADIAKTVAILATLVA